MRALWGLLVFLIAAGSTVAKEGSGPVTVSSPDGRLVIHVTDNDGQARYAATYNGATIIAPSKIGLLFKGHHGFDRDLEIVDVSQNSIDTRWEQPWGERRIVRDHHNEIAVNIASTSGPSRNFTLRVRAFDDGFGFRYEVADQPAFGDVAITQELTEFAVGEQHTAWWIPGGEYNRYEYIYNTTTVGEIEDAHTPITLKRGDGVHLSIHEAALVDYSGMTLQTKRPGTFRADLSPRPDGTLVKTATPFRSPWRTVQVSPDAAQLLNSSLILNLNEPNKMGDVSWVEPAKYVGIWWAMHIRERTWGNDGIHGATTEETKRYIDFAAEHGFKGVLVEGWNTGWDGDWYYNGEIFSFTEAYPDYDLEELGRYAASKGVSIIGHHETSGNMTNYEAQMADSFALLAKNGVKSVKTGYVADAGEIVRHDEKGVRRYEWHDGQFMVGHHLRVLKEAAKHKIAINSHEPVKYTGLRRTYPNWLSREGARGMEFNAWGNPPNPPEHTTILPYTRMLSGPMDFTPGIFDLEPNKRTPIREDMPRSDPSIRPMTTLAKQLALYVVLYSPVQMAADLPENYEKRMDAFQFIKDVPTDWEESIALNGEIGEYVTFVRKERGGDDWFLGSLTDEEARELELPLDFLSKNTRYEAQIYADADNAHYLYNPYATAISKQEVTRDTVLSLKLAPSGGTAIRFKKLD